MTDKPYGCQQYDINRLCRFDRRALDRKCDCCPRTTDRAYLESQGLWAVGISHQKRDFTAHPLFQFTPLRHE